MPQVEGYAPLIPADGRRRSKVSIVGFAGSSRDAYPKGDPDMELWGMNRLHEVIDIKGFARWFQIHPPKQWNTEKRAKEVARYRNFPMPIYMHDHYDDIPSSIPYPREVVERLFHQFLPILPDGADRLPEGRLYQTNTVSWMIALALLEDFQEIHIYGVDMVTDEEYGYQRPCCEFWLGLAAGLGVKTFLPAASALCTQQWYYGYEMRPQGDGLINLALLEARRKGEQYQKEQALAASNFHAGAVAQLDSLKSLIKHAERGGQTGVISSFKLAEVAQQRSAPQQMIFTGPPPPPAGAPKG